MIESGTTCPSLLITVTSSVVYARMSTTVVERTPAAATLLVLGSYLKYCRGCVQVVIPKTAPDCVMSVAGSESVPLNGKAIAREVPERSSRTVEMREAANGTPDVEAVPPPPTGCGERDLRERSQC